MNAIAQDIYGNVRMLGFFTFYGQAGKRPCTPRYSNSRTIKVSRVYPVYFRSFFIREGVTIPLFIPEAGEK